jgi:hypothetical protein
MVPAAKAWMAKSNSIAPIKWARAKRQEDKQDDSSRLATIHYL